MCRHLQGKADITAFYLDGGYHIKRDDIAPLRRVLYRRQRL
jgi:hypothetical protein